MKINTKAVFRTALSLAAVVLFGTQAVAQTCAPPTGPVVISNVAATSAESSWNASSSDPTGINYAWEVILDDGSAPGSGSEAAGGFTNNGVLTAVMQPLNFSTTYRFFVRYLCQEDPAISSTWIGGIVFTTSTLTTPVATPATSVTSVTMQANWNAVAGASKYFFDLSTTSDFSTFVGVYNDFEVIDETSLVVSGLTANTTYYYRVRAYGDNGVVTVTTANSNVITRTTLGPATSVYTWESPGVWVPQASVIDETKDVVINYDYNMDTHPSIEAKNMYINNGFTVTITDGNFLRLKNAVYNYNSNNSGLIVKSGGNLNQEFTGTNFNEGGMKVERESFPIYRLDYTMWSSPTSGKPGELADQTLKQFSPLTLDNRFYNYDSANNIFAVVPDPTTEVFMPGKGYLIRAPNNHPEFVAATTPGTSWLGQFEGPINAGNYTVPVNSGFNMVGNPYPSQLSLVDLFDANPNLTGTAYFWRRRNNTAGGGNTQAFYATFTEAGGTGPSGPSVDSAGIEPDSYATSGQGFLVESTTVGNVIFTNAMREHSVGNIPFFRTTADKNRFWLNVSHAGLLYNEMLIAYMPNATNGLDKADGKFIGDANIALTSYLNNQEYIIQGRAPFTVTDVVPLHFRAAVSGNYTIKFDRADGIFNADQNIFLKDNLTNVVHNIKTANYTFASTAGTFADRFEIVYTSSLSVGAPVFDANSVVLYKQNGAIQINAGNAVMNNVKVFDIRGRLVAEKNNINATETSITTGAENQVLIVQISSDNNGVVSKKFIN